MSSNTVMNTENQRVLCVDNFNKMTLQEQEKLIIQTFNNYYLAQVAYMNNVVIQKLTIPN